MNPEQLRILHVFDHSLPLHSGYSFRSAALLREQRKLGWKTIHITTPRHNVSSSISEEAGGLLFYRSPPLSPLVSKLPVVKELAQIVAVANRIEQIAMAEAPDLLHAHSPVLNALSCLLVSRRLRLPIVYEMRALWEDAAVSHGTTPRGGLRYRASRALETYALKQCDAIITICEGLRQEIIKRGISQEKIAVVPNGVDVCEFSCDRVYDVELRRSLNFEGKLVLGFLGSFYEYEGLEDLLRALHLIRQTRPDVVLLLGGGGPVRESLERQTQSLGLDDAVRFVGRIPHAQVNRYYALTDLFVYPRRPMRLTDIVTPLKPLEAMASGGTILASDVGGHRELIQDNVTGYLYPAGDVEALATKALDVIARRNEWNRVGTNARQYVERERRWETTIAGYFSAYPRALKLGVRSA